jgi:shikimate kinase
MNEMLREWKDMKENAEILNHDKNIVLIGFMGVGKTTIGQLAAKKLYWEFIDIDQEIEKRHHMSIPAMFEQKGEDYFRKVERELIVDVCTKERQKVLSLGGGHVRTFHSAFLFLKTFDDPTMLVHNL